MSGMSSMVPYQQQSLDPKSVVMLGVANRIANGQDNDVVEDVIATDVGSGAVINLSRASQGNGISTAETLKEVDELGYGKDSELAKGIVKVNLEMNEVLVEIGKTIVKRLKRRY